MPTFFRHIVQRIFLLFLLIIGGLLGVCQGVSAGLSVYVSPANSGKVKIDNGSWGTSASASTVGSHTISAQANTGYTFSHWSGSSSSTNATITLGLPKNSKKL